MVDNFDTNVARRKPNVARNARPIHPWDVVRLPDDTDVVQDEAVTNAPKPASIDSGRDTHVDSSRAYPRARDIKDSVAPRVDERESDVREEAPAHLSATVVANDVRAEEERSSATPSERFRAETVSRRMYPLRPAEQKKANSPSSPSSPKASLSSDLSNTISIHSNFCKLDNDISDVLFPRLSPSAQCVYLRLYRQSFGWNRNWAAESLPKLSKSCNLSLQTVRKAIKELELSGCIRKDFSDYHKATVYRIFLPAEINHSNNSLTNTAMSYSDSLTDDAPDTSGEISDTRSVHYHGDESLFSDTSDSSTPTVKNFDPSRGSIRPQESFIQSIYFSGASIYSILEGDGSLPKNISIYMTDKHLLDAVTIIDEFYDSIGFSVVSRAVYRKSVIDYFDLVKAGFAADDIRYAVRWTFKNSRSRPESFSLIKHTMHLAMDDLIRDLKHVSGEKDTAREKQEALKRTAENAASDARQAVLPAEIAVWEKVVEDLRNDLNDHSFKAFIEPLRLVASDSASATLEAPDDSVSWIIDHYRDVIAERYSAIAGREVAIAFERS